MTNNYLVIHTPGAFGNFMGHLIDCHKQKKLLPQSPFVESGASHRRNNNITRSIDMAVPGHWDQLEKLSLEKKIVGCVWKQEYFTYILHALYARTNQGQYGECGIKYAEKDFYHFIMNHGASERMQQNIVNLKELFNLEITKTNTHVPRHVLRMFFWLSIIRQSENIVSTTNQQIKDLPGIIPIDIQDILNYKKLKEFFLKEFAVDIDFQKLHIEFLERNLSMQDYSKANAITEAVKNKKSIEIGELSVVGEASVFYELEKHYFNIPFFNLVKFFKNTDEIINYVKYFPNFLKQPNKLFQQDYKRFPNPYREE